MIMSVRSYRDLVAWQRAMDLVVHIYDITRSWPSEERYGLTSQVRRAAVSIPSNIAEGHGRQSDRELLRYLSIAHGSLMEAETQLQIAQGLGYLQANPAEQLYERCAETGRIIHGLMKAVSAGTQAKSGG